MMTFGEFILYIVIGFPLLLLLNYFFWLPWSPPPSGIYRLDGTRVPPEERHRSMKPAPRWTTTPKEATGDDCVRSRSRRSAVVVREAD